MRDAGVSEWLDMCASVSERDRNDKSPAKVEHVSKHGIQRRTRLCQTQPFIAFICLPSIPLGEVLLLHNAVEELSA
jgi:hypothetical protein